MFCAHCLHLLGVSDVVFVETGGEPVDAICGMCAVQLIASPHNLVTLMLEPAAVMAGVA